MLKSLFIEKDEVKVRHRVPNLDPPGTPRCFEGTVRGR